MAIEFKYYGTRKIKVPASKDGSRKAETKIVTLRVTNPDKAKDVKLFKVTGKAYDDAGRKYTASATVSGDDKFDRGIGEQIVFNKIMVKHLRTEIKETTEYIAECQSTLDECEKYLEVSLSK